jgi:hypothetical protein
MSFTLIATRSMPTVSCLFMSKASFNLVPTPSVPATRKESPKGTMPLKPPMLGFIFWMRRTSSSPALMSTPAAL